MNTKLLVNGKLVKGRGEEQDVLNPATGKVIAQVNEASEEQIAAAVGAAAKAFAGWSGTVPKDRATLLLKLADRIEAEAQEFAALESQNCGKPLGAALNDEIPAIADVFRFFAGAARTLHGAVAGEYLPGFTSMIRRDPIGVVASIAPWNYPLMMAAWKLGPALAAGNTVVLKPSEQTPLTALRLATLLAELFPPGVVNIVCGRGNTVGAPLVAQPEVAMISLTGSTEVGRHVAELCGRDLRRVSLELGGKNAVIVMDDANLDEAVKAVSWAGFGTTGQRCTATSRVIVHEKVADAFTAKLAEAARKLRVGDGLLAETEMGPLVNQGRVGAVHEYTEIGQQEGARLVTGGHALEEGELSGGAYYAPTIFTDVTATMRIAQEEVFGPFVSILPVASYEEAVEVANSTIYGLSCAIFTEDARLVFRAMRDINAGLVYINAGTTGAEPHLPFGGTKQSGNGHRELGWKAVEEFSEIKTVFVSYPAHG